MTNPINVPGSLFPVTVDTNRLLEDAYQTDLLSAARREVAEHRRRFGETLDIKEARELVAERYSRGEHHLLPQFHAVSQRIKRRSR